MFKQLEKFLIITVMIQLLILSNVLAVTGNQPVIASRVSEVSEISVITDSGYNMPSTTFFGIETEVEILNRAKENQTVTESPDCYPKVQINAIFANQSLELVLIGICNDMSMTYSYPPGITVEYESLLFYMNQKGLTQLPDGNYTLWRPILGKQYITIITVNAGIIEIIYHSFYYNRTEEVSSDTLPTDETNFSLTLPIVCISILLFASTVYSRRRSRIS
ncbi:MAG: hypothetical protein HGN29_12445 [Asgard group archaeon]|nr:hypothetical protein [Asgard group archaeon]